MGAGGGAEGMGRSGGSKGTGGVKGRRVGKNREESLRDRTEEGCKGFGN